MTSRNLFAAAFAVLAIGAVASTAPTLAMAQTTAQKALIDAAKADGVVGEKADGYLEFRIASSDAALVAAVSTTNTARRAAYGSRAAEAGTTADIAGARMFETLILPRMPVGQWYRNASGDWVQK